MIGKDIAVGTEIIEADLADYIAGRPLPRYAPAFRLDRYQDPAYRTLLAEWGDSGQL